MRFLPLLTLAALSTASQLRTRHVLHQIPSGWTRIAPPPTGHLIDMRIGLKQARMDDLISTLEQVSDPAHERYGMHLSKAEVEELIAPRKESVESVEMWLREHGVNITERSSAGDWIHALVPVERAEKMLNTRYNIYRHESGTHVVRSESYALPRSLDHHIDVVLPTTFFGKPRSVSSPAIKKRASLQTTDNNPITNVDCNTKITPSCLKKLYKTEGYTPSGKGQNSIGITGFLEEYPGTIDLQLFYLAFEHEAIGSNFQVETINGGPGRALFGTMEANLDMQYAGALTYPIPNIYYSTGGRPDQFKADNNTPTNTNEPYVDWINYMLAKDTLPFTVSTSYGDDEQTVPIDYATRVCNGLAALGARGVSLLFAAGDDGVGPGKCLTNDPQPKTQFMPVFPATCPFVTSVGATIHIAPERGAHFSQGGFSNYFTRPDYQAGAVKGFLQGFGNTYAGLYNKTGRAFPDVAAQGVNYMYFINGGILYAYGTSASCPTFTSIITLLNDYRLSQGKPSLGFLNPWLYRHSEMLNDITTGNNPGCGTPGFNATKGWDPVTGLGTPDFEKMKALV